jgi:hypothetical protein
MAMGRNPQKIRAMPTIKKKIMRVSGNAERMVRWIRV